MRRFWEIVLKVLTVEAVVFAVLPLAGVSAITTLWFGLVMAAASYLLGDLFLLPALGNRWATVADAGMAMVTAVTEWYFHRLVMARRVPNV